MGLLIIKNKVYGDFDSRKIKQTILWWFPLAQNQINKHMKALVVVNSNYQVYGGIYCWREIEQVDFWGFRVTWNQTSQSIGVLINVQSDKLVLWVLDLEKIDLADTRHATEVVTSNISIYIVVILSLPKGEKLKLLIYSLLIHYHDFTWWLK